MTPRVKAAVDWIRRHYVLTENPGRGQAGLFYYYHTFAKAMAALGDNTFEDASGKKHDWRRELFDTLKEKQRRGWQLAQRQEQGIRRERSEPGDSIWSVDVELLPTLSTFGKNGDSALETGARPHFFTNTQHSYNTSGVFPMTERYQVRVTKDHLVFSAGHFITYAGDRCERLHGHDYRTTVEVEGDLDENSYVFDFIALKECARQSPGNSIIACSSPPPIRTSQFRNPLKVSVSAIESANGFFPGRDCVLLDMHNTTSELLARYIGQRLLEALRLRHRFNPTVVRVEVEENLGQSATYEWRHIRTELIPFYSDIRARFSPCLI